MVSRCLFNVAVAVCLVVSFTGFARLEKDPNAFVARLKYSGGGDWYNDEDCWVNLIQYANKVLGTNLYPAESVVEALDSDIYRYAVVFVTGHGGFVLSDEEAMALRRYVEAGGCIYIDDDYGLDKFAREAIKKIFPERKLEKIPVNSRIFNAYYKFDYLPKIHNHYPTMEAQILGVRVDGRWGIIYTFNTNLSDGWSDNHNDPGSVRQKALKFGVNLLLYLLTD